MASTAVTRSGTSLIVGIQPLPNQELASPECQIGKWNLPALVNYSPV
ncbi:hypothetical protein NIES806_34270 [Dolichospermum compactum NIES-806]|uniref:Uncharacterized protein n=2 Tax=Dolichospermum compactum TaxID=136073 RepID=A0A1Z4V6L9_9CYAN|nr:hypothetical protein NIES806_34270 [Dolichospermum compactum NIES-806]